MVPAGGQVGCDYVDLPIEAVPDIDSIRASLATLTERDVCGARAPVRDTSLECAHIAKLSSGVWN